MIKKTTSLYNTQIAVTATRRNTTSAKLVYATKVYASVDVHAGSFPRNPHSGTSTGGPSLPPGQ